RDAAVDLSDVAKGPGALARHIRRFATRPGGTVLGVGGGVPVVVEPAGRHVTVALSHDWHEVDLAAHLERAVGLPVPLASRRTASALGQLAAHPAGAGGRRAGEQVGQDLVYLYLGSGVIAGIVIGGRLHFGHDGTAGDLGHVMVDPRGP